MFGIFKKKAKRNIENKHINASSLYFSSGHSFSDHKYIGIAKEGYQMNAVAFRCINLIKQAVANVPFNVYEGEEGNRRQLLNHPMIEVVNKPNVMQSRSEFISEIASFFLIGGNSFVFNVNEGDAPRVLFNVRPDSVDVIGGRTVPVGYRIHGSSKIHNLDPVTGRCNIGHIKDFNPIDGDIGFSRMMAAAHSIDIFNESQGWNYSLLKNGARPDGVLSSKSNTLLTTEQYNEQMEMIKQHWSSSGNAGGVKLLGDLEWKPMSHSPKDMDFLQSQIMAARHIANVFGVPSQLLNIPESQTHSNYEQASLSFYMDTVIPIAENLYSGLFRWLNTFYGIDGLKVEVDKEKIPALETTRDERAEGFVNLVNAGIITPNEARQRLNYIGELEGGNEAFIGGGKMPISTVSDIIKGELDG